MAGDTYGERCVVKAILAGIVLGLPDREIRMRQRSSIEAG